MCLSLADWFSSLTLFSYSTLRNNNSDLDWLATKIGQFHEIDFRALYRIFNTVIADLLHHYQVRDTLNKFELMAKIQTVASGSATGGLITQIDSRSWEFLYTVSMPARSILSSSVLDRWRGGGTYSALPPPRKLLNRNHRYCPILYPSRIQFVFPLSMAVRRCRILLSERDLIHWNKIVTSKTCHNRSSQ